MSVEVFVTKPTVHETPERMYSIEVAYMLGDANAYASETQWYDEQDGWFYIHLKALGFMKTLELGKQEYEQNKVRISEYLEGEEGASPAAIQDFLEAFHQLDTTDESYDNDAQIESIKVYWYDDDGVQHDCVVKVNGEEL